MTFPRDPNEPYTSVLSDEELRRRATLNDDLRRTARLDNDPMTNDPMNADLQADPQLREGPASGSRVALYAAAAIAIVGAVLYGMTNMASGPERSASQPAPSSTASSVTPPAGGMRDVTPRQNTEPGTTTGAAPTQPIAPPVNSQTGGAAQDSTVNTAPAR